MTLKLIYKNKNKHLHFRSVEVKKDMPPNPNGTVKNLKNQNSTPIRSLKNKTLRTKFDTEIWHILTTSRKQESDYRIRLQKKFANRIGAGVKLFN